MEFFRFIERESEAFDRRVLILGALVAMTNLLVLFALTAASGKAVQQESNLWELIIVAAGVLTYWFGQGFVLRRTAVVVEGIIEKVRLRIIDKIRYSDLASIEKIGRAPAYNVISTHALNISRGATSIVTSFTAFALLCWASLIILYLSVTAFLILAGTVMLVVVALYANQARVVALLRESMKQDNRFVEAFGDLIDGFKELKLNSAKANDFVEVGLKPLAAEVSATRTEAALGYSRNVLLATLGLFIVLAVLVFLLPVLSPSEVSKLPRLTIFMVFLFGPLGQVVGVHPVFTDAIASIREIERVEQLLNSIHEQGLVDPISAVGPAPSFEMLECTTLAFSYRDERGQPSFSLEPFNFRLSKGDLVFITGGNGSGKSTFLKVLAGLYPPARGNIALNGVVVGSDNRQGYRNLFSAVFSDFHLFDRVYGIKEVDHRRLRDLLDLTDLSQKTSILDHEITALSLSSGQRKRLALVLSLLEDKPILLLDEWAAEQDPPFRRKFYREILPWLKEHEKTVVAVTHDDDHYDIADRVLKMRFGNFVPDVRD
jgi:putative pyoverdin transport system ATP-binding/permease protein